MADQLDAGGRLSKVSNEFQCRHHGAKYSNKDEGNFLDRLKIKLIDFEQLLITQSIRQKSYCEHDDLAEK